MWTPNVDIIPSQRQAEEAILFGPTICMPTRRVQACLGFEFPGRDRQYEAMLIKKEFNPNPLSGIIRHEMPRTIRLPDQRTFYMDFGVTLEARDLT